MKGLGYIFTYQAKAILLALLMCALLVGFQLLWFQSEKLPSNPEKSTLKLYQTSSPLLIVVSANEVVINGKSIKNLADVKAAVITYVDNNGSGKCSYCDGEKTEEGARHPKEARVQIVISTGVHYGRFASIQNEVNAAYRTLRENYSVKFFNQSFDRLDGKQQLIVTRSYPKAVQFEHVEPEWVLTSD
ncbi:MAG: hypothetical protein HWD92_11620 [Flavobacteriia bacterium]|nr:hypothetical protein [Flavobacteriia bacterium]